MRYGKNYRIIDTMKRMSLMLFLMVFAFTAPIYAEAFKVTTLSTREKHIKTYRKDRGEYLWKSSTWSTTYESQGKWYIKALDEGEGIWGNGNQFRTWHAETIYLYDNNAIVPRISSLVFKDRGGVTVESLTVKYDEKHKKAVARMLNSKKEFEFREGLIDKNALGIVLMNYPYERENDFVFPMLTNEPSYYSMTMVNRGKEILTVNGASFECYKLQMVPDLGFLGIFAPFVPKTYFWYTVSSPHEFIRYEGLESGLNTPYIVMEAQD